MGEALIIILVIALIVFMLALSTNPAPKDSEPQSYPYKPGIEFRLPSGELTTKGYAAVHPTEFMHWQCGRYVMGEVIESTDWEDWNINFFGE